MKNMFSTLIGLAMLLFAVVMVSVYPLELDGYLSCTVIGLMGLTMANYAIESDEFEKDC